MPYNPYFPNYYSNGTSYAGQGQHMPLQQPTMSQNVAQMSNSGITWVQGESAAKSFPVGAGQSVLLMDSEDSVMYIKSTDQSGMPLPLRIFDYTERTQIDTTTSKNAANDYVSRSEFDAFKENVSKMIGQNSGRGNNVSEDKSNAQSTVQSTSTPK